MMGTFPHGVSELQAKLESFDRRWHLGDVPCIDEFLRTTETCPLDDAQRSLLIIELVMIDLECRWRKRVPNDLTAKKRAIDQPSHHQQLPDLPKLEDYVQRYPSLGPLEKLPVRLIVEEYLVRSRWGDRPTLEDYQRRFKTQANELPIAFAGIDSFLTTQNSSSAASVRCPLCHNPIELREDCQLSDIHCPTCSSNFSLLGDDALLTTGPTLLAHFELVEPIGAGSFGTVWKARDTELDRTVAIKIPRNDHLSPSETERFLREARAAAQLKHPNVVTVHEVGREKNTAYIVSDYVEGPTLASWLSERRFSYREAAQLCSKLAMALHHAHENGVIHRDLKPSNIILDAHGEPHITDFGLARRETTEVTVTMDGKLLGTPAYMSPEQAKGESHRSDRRSDVYSLGIVLFELLTGEKPFRGNVRMLLHKVIHDQAPSPCRFSAAIPKDLETICLKCLEKDPRGRFATAGQLAEELERFRRGEPILSRPITSVARAVRWCSRHRALAAAMGLLVFVAVSAPLVAISRARAAERYRWLLYIQDLKLAQAELEDAQVDHAVPRLSRQVPRGWQTDLRGFEWYFLFRLCKPSLVTPRLEHDSAVGSLDFSPGGEILATGGLGTLSLWDVFAKKRADDGSVDLHQELTTDLACSPDDQLLAASSEDGKYILWNWRERSEPMLVTNESTHGKNCLAFSPPHGDFLVTEAKQEGQLKVWNVRLEKWESPIEGEQRGVRCLVFSPDGKTLVAAGQDKKISRWSFPSGDFLTEYPVADTIESLAFSPDGITLAVGLWNGQIEIRDALTGELTSEMAGHTHVVSGVAFSSDGTKLASCSWDGTVIISDVATHEQLAKLRGHAGAVTDVAFSPDDQVLASADVSGNVRIWNCPAVIEPKTEPASRSASNTARSGARTWYSDGEIRRLNDTTGHTESLFSVATANFAAYCPNKNLIAVGQSDGSIEILDLRWSDGDAITADSKTLVETHNSAVEFLLFSSNGEILVSAAGGDELKLWRRSTLSTFDLVATLPVHRGYPPPFAYPVAISSDGKTLAAATKSSSDKFITIKVWDTTSGIQRRTIGQERIPITSIAFQSNSLLASGNYDGSIKIWEINSGTQLRELNGHSYAVYSLAFSPDGTRLASGSTDQTVKLWNPFTGDLLLSLARPHRVYWVAFSSDGQSLSCGNMGSQAILWRAASKDEVKLLNGK